MDTNMHVLRLIKRAQKEHGISARNDFACYHRYCTTRLRRLYAKARRHQQFASAMHPQRKSNGKTKVKAKNVAPALLHQPFLKQINGAVDNEKIVNDHLLILLFLAERAWSQAMAKKQSAHPHQRSRLIARLAKAVKWAELFSRTCAHTANPRTFLEAIAYAANLKGFYLIELEQSWDVARENLHNAKVAYEALASMESADQEIFRRIVEDEIGPSILYCTHKMGMHDQSASVPGESSSNVAVITHVISMLTTCNSEAMVGSSSQATKRPGFLYWLDHKYALDNARLASCIQKAQCLEAKFDALKSSERQLVEQRRILRAYQDAQRHIREDLMAGGMPQATASKDGLLGLDRAVSGMILQQTLRCKELMVCILESCLCKHPNSKEEQKATGLFDSLLETLADLYELCTSGRDPSRGEITYASQLAFRKLAYQAQRCFYLAQAQCRVAQYARAHLLYQRAQEYVAAALSNPLPLEHQLAEDQHIRGIILELEELSEECRRALFGSCFGGFGSFNEGEPFARQVR